MSRHCWNNLSVFAQHSAVQVELQQQTQALADEVKNHDVERWDQMQT